MGRFLREAAVASFLVLLAIPVRAHLCDNVFRQKDKLIVKPEIYNIVMRDSATFKVFLQNNMDRGIAEISLVADSPDFDFKVTPQTMSIPKDARVFFQVTMTPRTSTRTGKYPISFRLIGGGREFYRFGLDAEAAAATEQGAAAAALVQAPRTSAPPEIDGVLSDACWKTAGVLSNFATVSGGTASARTTGLLLSGDGFFYLGLRCGNAGDQPAGKERLTVILSQDGRTHYYIGVTPSGEVSWKKYVGTTQVDWMPRNSRASARPSSGFWSAEMSLSLADLGAESFADGAWFLRLVRVKLDDPPETSYWAADTTGYHNVSGYGRFLVPPR